MNLTKHILLIPLLFFTGILSAQTVLKAEVNKTEIGLNEKVQVTFTLTEDSDNFNPPDFKNFEVIDGSPIRGQSVGFENGRRTNIRSFTYTLKPKRTGTFTIGVATVKVDGSIYESNTLSIEVKRKRKKNYIIDKDSLEQKLFLKLEYPKESVSMNDSITVLYKLYVSSGIGVKSIKEIKESNISNAEVTPITSETFGIENQDLNGVTYRSLVIRKLKLNPSRKGKLKIGPLKIEVTALIPSGRKGIANKNIEDEKLIILSSNKATIRIN